MGAVQCATASYADFAKEAFAENTTPEKLAAWAEEHFAEDDTLRTTITRERLVGRTLLDCDDAAAVDFVRGCSPRFQSWLAHVRAAEHGVEATALGAGAGDAVVRQPATPAVEV